MPSFRNVEEALDEIDNEAAADAWTWLVNNKPRTLTAIKYLIEIAKMREEDVIKKLERTYKDSEPNVRHKMALVVQALARGQTYE